MRLEMRQMGPFVTQQPVECHKCSGEGVIINPGDECKVKKRIRKSQKSHLIPIFPHPLLQTCGGHRVQQKSHVLEIPIEKGSATGDKVVLKGEASQKPGEAPGDIVVFLVEQTPDDFPFKVSERSIVIFLLFLCCHAYLFPQRQGDDLFYKHKLSLTEALIGFKFSVRHMDDRVLVVTSQHGDVIRPGSKKVVLGEGMPIKVRVQSCFFFPVSSLSHGTLLLISGNA